MRSLPLILIMFVASLISLSACGDNQGSSGESVDRSKGTALYKEQKAILQAYIDTLVHHSSDTAAMQRSATGLQAALQRAAYKYPADADFLFTSAQQDTIRTLTHKYLKLLKEKVPDAMVRDTVAPIDTLSPQLPDSI